MRSAKLIHQSTAALDPGNIYTSSAYEKTKRQYNERMHQLRASNASHRAPGGGSRSRGRFRRGKFELQPQVRSQREQAFNSYGLSRRPPLDHQALLEKYGSRENLNIYSKKKKLSRKKYIRAEYHY